VTILDSKFLRNTANSSDPTVFEIQTSDVVTITNSQFTENKNENTSSKGVI